MQKADSKLFFFGKRSTLKYVSWQLWLKMFSSKKRFFYSDFADEGREARGDQEAEESERKAGIAPPQLSPPGDLETFLLDKYLLSVIPSCL